MHAFAIFRRRRRKPAHPQYGPSGIQCTDCGEPLEDRAAQQFEAEGWPDAVEVSCILCGKTMKLCMNPRHLSALHRRIHQLEKRLVDLEREKPRARGKHG